MPLQAELQSLTETIIEPALHAAAEPQPLSDPRLAEIVWNALKFFDGQRYDLLAWSVMPNHVHGIIVITDVAAGSLAGDGCVGAANSPPLRMPATNDPVDPPPPNVHDNSPRRPPIAIMVKNSLGHIMQTFKAAVTRQAIRDGLMPRGTPIWQRGYYERIIRDGGEHDRIAQYIRDNPANWKGDRFNR
jgi:REP element-mobilizing transposase RayT